MSYEEKFSALAQKHGWAFKHQRFTGFKRNVDAYSIYGNFGCFTLCDLSQSDDLYCFASDCTGENFEELCKKALNLYKVDEVYWAQKEKKAGLFKRKFFYKHVYVDALIELIDALMQTRGEFLELFVEKGGK